MDPSVGQSSAAQPCGYYRHGLEIKGEDLLNPFLEGPLLDIFQHPIDQQGFSTFVLTTYSSMSRIDQTVRATYALAGSSCRQFQSSCDGLIP